MTQTNRRIPDSNKLLILCAVFWAWVWLIYCAKIDIQGRPFDRYVAY